MKRITNHPILEIEEGSKIPFYWNGEKLLANQGEMLSSALIANDVNIFGHHPKDGSAQGIFCANGQCAQCTVIANGIPVKSCMTEVKKNMIAQSCDELPQLPDVDEINEFDMIEEIETDVLIIGGGPSGLSAGIELGEKNIKTLLVDDKSALGGKLVLQTHKFFGSIKDCYAGTRGIDIAKKLAKKIQSYSSLNIWMNSIALYVFSDKRVGVLKNDEYILVKPKTILNASGAREKMLAFPGNTLPGVYGAGAFQTLVNRDLVRSSQRIFILGGGNVGLIAAYHALQAGIEVVGIAEAMEKCGGYKVHADKIKRLGVPIYTSHTISSVNGKDGVESVTFAKIDENFKPIPDTDKTIACDTVLIAVGLDSISEFQQEAENAGMTVFSTGDAAEIAEASSAMFNGKIVGIKIAKEMKFTDKEIPSEWTEKAEILKSPPGKIHPDKLPEDESGVFPVIHCVEEIPCNPCTSVCPYDSIEIPEDSLMGIPRFKGKCVGCGKCLTICPALAITLVDFRKDTNRPIVSIPYEVGNHPVKKGEVVKVTDIDGNVLADLKVEKNQITKSKAQIIQCRSPKDIAKKIAGLRIQDRSVSATDSKNISPDIADDVIVCRCERVTAREIRKWIKKGVTDMNQLKQLTRAGMGACGAKTCENLILKMYKEEGYSRADITFNTRRPIFVEVPFSTLSGKK